MKVRQTLVVFLFALLATAQVHSQGESWQKTFDTGVQHYESGRFAEAEKSLQRAVELAPGDSIDLADSWNWLGLARWKLAKYPEAEAAHKEARPLYKKLRGERSAPFAFSTNNLGLVYWHQGRLKEGDELLNQALKILEDVEGAKGINLARGLNNTGGLYRGRGFWKKAEPLLLRSIEIFEFRKFPHGDSAHPYNNLGRLRQDQGKMEEAIELFQKGLDVSKKKLNAQHPQIGDHSCVLGDALRRHGKLEAAEKALLAGMKIIEEKLPAEHSARANGLNYLAELRRAQGNKEDAHKLFEQSLSIWGKQTLQPPVAAITHLRFAHHCADTDKPEAAKKHFQTAIEIFEKTSGSLSPDLADALESYAKYLHSTDADQAAKLRDRAKKVRITHAEENK